MERISLGALNPLTVVSPLIAFRYVLKPQLLVCI
jgi:hypothetical protein